MKLKGRLQDKKPASLPQGIYRMTSLASLDRYYKRGIKDILDEGSRIPFRGDDTDAAIFKPLAQFVPIGDLSFLGACPTPDENDLP